MRSLACILFAATLAAAQDWPQFTSSSADSGLAPSTLASLERRQVRLDGTVDASAIYLHQATVKGLKHDTFFVITSYGKTIAIDAGGRILWEYTPDHYASWAGSAQITNSTPVADPDRQYIYAAAPDGAIRKLAISDGHALWTTPITLLPRREKIASPLKIFHGRIIAVTGGYIGDRPPYQGHVAILDAQSGKLLHVWNSLCSDRAGLIDPKSCRSTRSAIWGRAGAEIDPQTGNIFVATGNGPYNGKTDWGDSIIELDPDAARVIGNYTPAGNTKLDDDDLDLGSTSPALMGSEILAQGGKDRLIRLLSIDAIAGTAAHVDHELQTVPTPSRAMLFTALAAWHLNGETWLFAADNGASAAWTLRSGKLAQAWRNSTPGTSPIVAGGVLYIYDPRGGLYAYDPVKGTQIAKLEAGRGHWNSPIIVDGHVALGEGNANRHATSGVFDIWSRSARVGQ